MEKITVLIPCYNEEKGVGKVIESLPIERLEEFGYETEVIVINNNSTDKTEEVAKEKRVKVIHERKRGKGNAIRAGFNALSEDADYVVMLDGDNTYKAQEIPRLIEPLKSDFSDVIIGSRLGGKTKKNAFKFQNRVVNWFFTFLVRQFYRANVTDVLSGYFAWKKEVVDKLAPHLTSDGFAIEMEMISKMVKLGFEVYSVPITYDQREGETKINSLKDGVKILHTFLKNLIWVPMIKDDRKKTKLITSISFSNEDKEQ